MRIVIDQKEIQSMIEEGYDIKTMVSWHSPDTLETHCLPIFAKDKMEDIINRYYDYFPKECKATLQACQDIRSSLHNPDGMSKAKTMMASFKIPLGLNQLLEAWYPGMFDVEEGTFKHKRAVDAFLSLMPKLRTKLPHGKLSIST